MFNNKKSKRGFSLVELMVVVAIMGTLAAIAIPAYNEYRRSAKKNAYKADLTSLHKGWLAFGVELDSFCERETSPQNASIGHVGMASLNSSKLYGRKGVCEGSGTCSAPDILLINGAFTSTACDNLAGLSGTCTAAWDSSVGNAPAKHNFIGFGQSTCDATSVPISGLQIIGNNAGGGQNTMPDSACSLTAITYTMGVYGHVSGNDAYGVSINNNGVVGDQVTPPLDQQADAGC